MHCVFRVHCASLRPWLWIPSFHIRGEHGSVHLYGAGGETGEDRWILRARQPARISGVANDRFSESTCLRKKNQVRATKEDVVINLCIKQGC